MRDNEGFHEIRQADKVILPGVGSFGEAMTQLKKYELDKVIQEVAEEKSHFLASALVCSFYLRAVRKAAEWKVCIC